jgi:hypothetical protein
VLYFIATESPALAALIMKLNPGVSFTFLLVKILSQKAIHGQKLGQNTGKSNRPCSLKKIKSAI